MSLLMRRSLLVLLSFCIGVAANAQPDSVARLYKLIKGVERTYQTAYRDSFEYFVHQAIPLSIRLDDVVAETRIKTFWGTTVFLNGYFDSAVTIQLTVARKGEQRPLYIELAQLYYELSGIYGRGKYHDISTRYIRKGLAIAHSLNNDSSIADGYNRLGVLFERENKLDSALHYYEMSRDINHRLGHILGESYSLENIGGIYNIKNEQDKALLFLRQSVAYREQLDNKISLAIAYMNMGETFAGMKNYDSSIYYTNKSLQVALVIKYRDITGYAYNFLSGVYEKKGDYKTALHYHQLFSALNDSLYNEKRSQQLAEMNTKYETEKKEQQIDKLHQQTEIQSLQIRQRNIFITAAAILVLIAAAVTWLAYNRRKLQEQARLQKAINRQQEITAREVIQAEERERRRIAADLHDGVGQLLSAALMNLNGLFNKTPMSPESQTLSQHSLALVTESYDELRQISHQMIPNTLLKVGLASAVKDMIMRIDQSRLSISLEADGLDSRLDEEIETVLYRVIQESVNNVIKHSAATRLNIQLTKDEEGVAVTIEDNGKGFDLKQKDKGIGLKNMLSRVQFHKGTIDIDSSPGKGTLVAVFIPVAA